MALVNVKDAPLYGILIIILNDDTVELIERLEAGIDKELMQRNWAERARLASMTHQSHEFNLLHNKLVRQRNIVDEGFYQANQLIERTLESLS